MSRLLVIGGSGVIGHFVVRSLIGRGHRPVVLSATGRTKFLSDILDRIDLVAGDMTDRAALSELIRERSIGRIAHLGAILHDASERDPPAAVRQTVEGIAGLLDDAARLGVERVVFASSKAVYGPVEGDHAHPTYDPLPEDFPLRPASMYGITKLSAEMVGRWYGRNRGIEFAAVRFGSTVGPGKLLRHGNTSIHSRIIESAMAGRPVDIPRGGDAVTDTVFNGDIGDGIAACLMADRLAHDAYNLATGTGITLGQFADAVRERYPGADISIGPGTQYLRPDSAGHCILSIDRAARDFGYRPSPEPRAIVTRYLEMMDTLGLRSAFEAPVQAADQGG